MSGSVWFKSDEEELEHGSSPIIPYPSGGLNMNEVSSSAQCPSEHDFACSFFLMNIDRIAVLYMLC